MSRKSFKSLRRAGVFSLLTVGAPVGVAGACFDPAARYDERPYFEAGLGDVFVFAQGESSDGESSDGESSVSNIAPEQVDPSGLDFYININFVPIANFRYQLLAHLRDFSMNEAGELVGTGELRDEDQTLADPAGGVFDVVIYPDGSALLDMPALDMVIAQVAVIAKMQFEGYFFDNGTLCGTVVNDDSSVSAPLEANLKGSTFGAVPITMGSTLPNKDTVPRNCAGIVEAANEGLSLNFADAGGDATVSPAPL